MHTEKIKYISAQSLLLCLLYILLQSSCSTTKIDIDTVKNTKGWIDNNTYAIIALGRPLKSLTSESKKKDSAKRAALINARFKILKKFKTQNMQEPSDSVLPETKKSMALLIKNIIKNGKIVYENFDQRNNCEIIYQVQYKNLKEIIKNADLSIVDVVY